MTKKHYEAIAGDVRTANVYANNLSTVIMQDNSKKTIRLLTLSLCNTFIVDNPKFKRDMFLESCGVEKS